MNRRSVPGSRDVAEKFWSDGGGGDSGDAGAATRLLQHPKILLFSLQAEGRRARGAIWAAPRRRRRRLVRVRGATGLAGHGVRRVRTIHIYMYIRVYIYSARAFMKPAAGSLLAGSGWPAERRSDFLGAHITL